MESMFYRKVKIEPMNEEGKQIYKVRLPGLLIVVGSLKEAIKRINEAIPAETDESLLMRTSSNQGKEDEA